MINTVIRIKFLIQKKLKEKNMKKKFFGALVVIAIAVGAMINVNLNKVSNKADLTLANQETLAQVEVPQGTQSIQSETVSCRIWAIEPETGEPCYIDITGTKITCPKGTSWCTPFSPC